jgi:polyisoprenyl-phosphate glycosyltransferase
MKISYIVPLFNSEASLHELTNRLTRLPGAKEIIYVNDGSTDITDAVASAIQNIMYINLGKNYGQQYALMTGIRKATGDVIVCLDDDLQTPPEESKKLINALVKHNFDVVYGNYETNEDLLRKFGTRLNNILASYFGKPKSVTLTSFFAMKKSVANKITSGNYLPAQILRITKNIGSVGIAHDKRKYGSSGYGVVSLMKLWLTGLWSYLHPPSM